jgi:3D (Asp-Asp-Asp) domain-containing protein
MMLLSKSLRWKIVATAGASLGFVLLYQVTVIDSRYAARQAVARAASAPPAPGARLRFTATAYCKGTTTASGVRVRTGIAAADPQVLPPGSVIEVGGQGKHSGIYTIMDTGPAVQGRIIDIYMWSCYEALEFGRRSLPVTVLRLGWNPRATRGDLAERPAPRPATPASGPRLPSVPTTGAAGLPQ